jgi:ubiquinone/menaquinone biosynthesis C-methylase UbiE
MNRLDSMVSLVHQHIAAVVPKGGRAVDATAGNGQDTLFLARLVGPAGRVWAFDIQPAALARTQRLLLDEGVSGRVHLVPAGHEELDRHLDGPVDAVMFNLGYLPGGNRKVTTRAETTATALRRALAVLRLGGRASLVCYPGHPEGARETAAVEDLCAALPPRFFAVVSFRVVNRQGQPPLAIIIEKVGGTE